mmetsp:Transcript_43258/g.104573  ORF Transcript_43258/g.104573 Transcript_43258/m.104573 type:complete len:181 (-) Transcript_43258:34-576(-)
MREKLRTRGRGPGKAFVDTGGVHLTHDDMFFGDELNLHENEVKSMEAIKQFRQESAKREAEAKALLESKTIQEMKSNDLKLLLHWYGIPPKDQPSKVKDKRKEWLDRVDEGPVRFAEWTDTDEAQLTELRNKELDISDTAVGRARKETESDMLSVFANYTQEEQEALLQKLQEEKKGSST